jgi:hypothetical protein
MRTRAAACMPTMLCEQPAPRQLAANTFAPLGIAMDVDELPAKSSQWQFSCGRFLSLCSAYRCIGTVPRTIVSAQRCRYHPRDSYRAASMRLCAQRAFAVATISRSRKDALEPDAFLRIVAAPAI